MVDHWPVSTVLSEDEQKLIKDHREGKQMYLSDSEKEMVQLLRQEREVIVNEQNEKSPNQRAVEELDRLRQYLNAKIGPFDPNYSPSLVDMIISLYENKQTVSYMNEYQNKAAETAIYPGKGTPLGLIYCTLKLCGEAGEVSENVGKALRDDGYGHIMCYPSAYELMNEDRRYKLKLELGDVLWYVSQAAKELGFTLEEIAEENLSKIASRKERGTLKGSGDER